MLAVAPAPADAVLPAGLLGDWKGTLRIRPLGGKPQDVPMELHVSPAGGGKPSAYRWQIVYGEGDKRQVRDYELRPDDKDPSRLVIDEKNGIVLDAAVVGTALVSQFRVGKNLLYTRYAPRGRDHLLFEVTVFAADDVRKTEPVQNGTGAQRIEVSSYHVVSSQSAELTRYAPAGNPAAVAPRQ